MNETSAYLPTGWFKGRLGDAVSPRGEKVSPVDYPTQQFLGMNHVEAHTTKIIGGVPAGTMKSSAARFYSGDVLYGRLRPYLNKVTQPKFDGLASAEFIVFPENEAVLGEYLLHRLNAADFVSFAAHLDEGDRPRIKFEQIADFEFLLPPLNEQRRIVAKIEELFSEQDKGIESLKTAREQLKIYRQSLLKHAFEGNLTEQWRKENPDKLEPADALLARITREREMKEDDSLKEWKVATEKWEEAGQSGKKPSKPKHVKKLVSFSQDEIDKLPTLADGWLWVRLGELFLEPAQNGIYKPADFYGSGTSIVRIDDFYDGLLIRRDGFKKLRLSEDEIKKYRVRNSEVLINRVNSIEYLGKCAHVVGLSADTVFESNIMKVVLVDKLISDDFVTAYLASHDGRKRLCENAKHAVNQASINQSDVSNSPVPLAPQKEQFEVGQLLSKRLTELDRMKAGIDHQMSRSSTLRQSILKKAFSGQLVPQDPNDEPASVLLERINAKVLTQATGKKANRGKKKARERAN